jgi:hypothetical protein
MPIKHAIFAGSIAAIVSLTPALARHSDAPKTSEQSTASPCSALQRMADGTWTPLPCQELGSPKQTPRKSATQSSEQQPR